MNASELIREAAGMKRHAWTCTACDTPCSLELVQSRDGPRFRSSCCTAAVRPTKEGKPVDTEKDTRPTYCSFMILDKDKKELLAKATELAREQLVAAGWKPEDIEDEALPNYWIYPGGARTYVLNVKADSIPEAQS